MEDPKPKTKRLKGKAYTELRHEVGLNAKWRCEICGNYAPFTTDGRFDQKFCGHVHHKKTKGSGGADDIKNCQWLCSWCHDKQHGPKFSGHL